MLSIKVCQLHLTRSYKLSISPPLNFPEIICSVFPRGSRMWQIPQTCTSCRTRAVIERAQSCGFLVICEYIPCWGETNSSLPTVGVCVIPPQEQQSSMKQCIIMFSLVLSLFSVSLLHCVLSPSSDFGLPRDPSPGARRVCQPPLPRRRDPKSQTPLAEEWHGSAG